VRDGWLSHPELSAPIVAHWRREVTQTRRAVLSDGRPTIAMKSYVRVMVLKACDRWGYRTLVAEVSDSIPLRRFCRGQLAPLAGAAPCGTACWRCTCGAARGRRNMAAPPKARA
jgi:hypothetical protein